MLNLHLQLPHAIQLNGGTNVTSLGHARYTAYATTFAYPGLSPEIGKPSQSGGFYENLVRGRVIEENGPPVAGAALRIDGELVFSDSGGAFFLRRKKAKLYPLEVLPNQFMLPGRFEVVSAPFGSCWRARLWGKSLPWMRRGYRRRSILAWQRWC